MREFINKNYDDFTQFIRYLLVGFVNTIVVYCSFLILLMYTHYLISSLTATIIALSFSYALNKKWTFKNNQQHKIKAILVYYSMYAISSIITSFILIVFVEYIKLQPTLSGVLVIPISTIMNYLGQKYWVFK